ncbi:hypothetical protein [Kutzneria sp. NPDC051319]|uniref:hypothetical protein n=1 Tax=Kutzneria sp. NPDC051319 TaxID=3155047 RepID=UPI003424C369
MVVLMDTVGGFLDLLGVAADKYAIGGEAHERWCLTAEDDGTWHVFWSERGSRFDEVPFAREEDACVHLIGRFAVQQLTQGLLQARPN